MGNNTWDNCLDPHAVARGTAKTTFTAIQDISPTPLPQSYANELKLGTKIVVEAVGEFSTTGTPTLAIGVYYGAVAQVWNSGTITTGSGAAAWPWHLRWNGIVTTVGSSGVLYGHGILDLGTSLTAWSPSSVPVTAAARSVAVDTTAAKSWGIAATWGTSSASNSITVDLLNVQILNQGKT
jgi:hypothetical protein